MKKQKFYYFTNLMFPAVIFGSVVGLLTAVIIALYKFSAAHIIEWSEIGYEFLKENLIFIPLVLIILFGIALLYSKVYKKIPNVKGGGIPTSIGILRGLIPFRFLTTLIGTFFLSLLSFLIGVPLGNEGPSVQMGTAIGKGCVYPLKKHKSWSRYLMTGGSCAGFSVATGAPVSGIMFAIEEAHQRLSPMIIIVGGISVAVSRVVTEILSPLLGISVSLFPEFELLKMTAKDSWIPLVIGILLGLFAVLFLKFYSFMAGWFAEKIQKIPDYVKIFIAFALTLVMGLISLSFISTGHHLTLEIFGGSVSLIFLILIVIVRSVLTFFANSNGVTGGIFLPIMAIGAAFSGIIAKLGMMIGLSEEYYTVILVLGITACISGMMTMPLTAIVFGIEALGCYENLLPVIIASSVTYMITELCGAKSINDQVLENRLKAQNKGKKAIVIDTFVTVKPGTFAVGKQIRDIFWPANLFVLSVKHSEKAQAKVDEHGDSSLRAGDILHIRYSTFDDKRTRQELIAIIGEQEINAAPVSNV